MKLAAAIMLTSVFLFTACSSFRSRHDQIERYLRKNPETHNEIADALYDGRLVTGMTRDQVRLSWGDPTSIRLEPPQLPVQETWMYSAVRSHGSDLQHSSLWNVEIPLGKAVFDGAGILIDWISYTDPQPAPATPPAVAPPAVAPPQPRPAPPEAVPRSVSAPAARNVSQTGATPANATADSDWPQLELKGILIRGSERYALIGNRILRLHESIHGAEVVDIQEDRIRLRFQGEEREMLDPSGMKP